MAERRRWARRIAAAGGLRCRRCPEMIYPGDEWDLGHPPDKPFADGNKTEGLEPEHRHCNRTGKTTTNQHQPTFTGWP